MSAQRKPLTRLKVVGNGFTDEEGDTMVFRGVSTSDPDRLEKAGHWNKAYLEATREWNSNVVRFPVHPSAWRERGQENYFQLLDDGIRWAGELSMYVIIDWHSIGNLQTEIFQAAMYVTTKSETCKFWSAIAARYKDDPVVSFYELFNEPTDCHGEFGTLDWTDFKLLMEDIISVIFAHNTTAIPLVGGLNWAYDLKFVRNAPIEYPGIAYVTHPYPQKREQPWELKWEADWGFVADTYPIVATELGFMSESDQGAHIPVIGDETFGNAIIDFFEKKGVSWLAWVFDPEWSPQLINNWTFDPTHQGKFFRMKITELNLRI